MRIQIAAHPPERRRRATTLLSAGCGCSSSCCCCCCVHTVGGLAGALYGSLRRDKPAPESLDTEEKIREEAEAAAAHRYAVKLYWLVLTILGALTIAVSLLVDPREPVVGPALILGFLPGGQIVASVICAFVIRARKPPRQDLCYRRIARITGLVFIGSILGIFGTVVSFTLLK